MLNGWARPVSHADRGLGESSWPTLLIVRVQRLPRGKSGACAGGRGDACGAGIAFNSRREVASRGGFG